jgi:hypothetical protein
VVREGDRLGAVIDPIGVISVPVVADAEGILLFLRVSPAVRKDDGLGGILPISQPGEVCYERHE